MQVMQRHNRMGFEHTSYDMTCCVSYLVGTSQFARLFAACVAKCVACFCIQASSCCFVLSPVPDSLLHKGHEVTACLSCRYAYFVQIL